MKTTTKMMTLSLLLLGASVGRADDAKKPAAVASAKETAKSTPAAHAGKNDPTGTWKWSFKAQNGNTYERSVNLKREGNKLTGVMVGNGGEAPISGGQIKDSQISFIVAREKDGKKIVAKYQGKVDGDAIKGTMVRHEGEPSAAWEAKRIK
jgi:hypothetical protein